MTPNTPEIPPLFLERMSRLLGDEYPAFAESLNAAPKSGLRVNTLKLTPDAFKALAPFPLGDKVPWCDSAFILPVSSFSPGLHPYHMAGLYYMQDPSAMSPAELLNPQPGERVLDLAAAPGGKTTHLAALMQGRGLLVANEIKDKRVGHLAQNVERWGAGNVVVTNETPERLADHFGASFDRVLVDAPCSGEGMFRKDMGARVDWSPEMVAGCAVRQRNILRVAAKLVKPGGFLLYSTCTFAPEEDEAVISGLLNGKTDYSGFGNGKTDGNGFSEFEMAELPQFPGFMPGRPDWVEDVTAAPSLAGAVRLFPHRIEGEGHFACLLRKKDGGGGERYGELRRVRLSKEFWGLWRGFAEEALSVNLTEERLRVVGERLYFVPEESLDFGRLRVVHPGVWLGTFKKGRFEPAHPLALFLKPGEAKNTLELSLTEITAYLRGESLASDAKGWTLVTVSGFGIGWGKGVQGTLKNHYPRGWM